MKITTIKKAIRESNKKFESVINVQNKRTSIFSIDKVTGSYLFISYSSDLDDGNYQVVGNELALSDYKDSLCDDRDYGVMEESIFSISGEKIYPALQYLSNDELKLRMCGIAFTPNGLCATNAHILYWNDTIKTKNECIIPKLTFEILKSERIKEFNIQFFKKGYKVVTDKFTISGEYVDVKFPDFKNVIPLCAGIDKVDRFIIDKKEMLNALKVLIPFANKSTYKIEFKDNVAVAQDLDRNIRKEVELSFGDKEINLNGKYLQSILKVCKSKKPPINYYGGNRAIEIIDDGNKSLSLIMPIL